MSRFSQDDDPEPQLTPAPPPITRRLTCDLFEVGKPNHNGRTYLEEQAKLMAETVNEQAKLRRAMGCLDHPQDGRTRLQDVSHLCEPDFSIENGRLAGSVTSMSTPQGLLLRELLANNVELTLAPRGFGSVGEDGVIGPDFKLAAVDIVMKEAVPRGSS